MKKLAALSAFIVLGFVGAYAQGPSKTAPKQAAAPAAAVAPASSATATLSNINTEVAAEATPVGAKAEAKKECSSAEKKACSSASGKKSCCSSKSEAKK